MPANDRWDLIRRLMFKTRWYVKKPLGFKWLIYEGKALRIGPERSPAQTVPTNARFQQTDITKDSSAKLSEPSPMILLSEVYSDGTRRGTINRFLMFNYSRRTASVVYWSEFLATDTEVSGSIPGTTRFSE